MAARISLDGRFWGVVRPGACGETPLASPTSQNLRLRHAPDGYTPSWCRRVGGLVEEYDPPWNSLEVERLYQLCGLERRDGPVQLSQTRGEPVEGPDDDLPELLRPDPTRSASIG